MPPTDVVTPLILALDAGTTGVRALAIDDAGRIVAERYRETLPEHPAPGLVEHDTEALWHAVLDVVGGVLGAVDVRRVRGLGITTQRGTAVVWERAGGRALHPAISWSDARAEARCTALMGEGVFVSPLMAASKLEWILDRVDADRSAVRAGRVLCGTLDAWLAFRFSDGKVFATDPSNAVPSGFYNLVTRGWDEAVLAALRIPQGAIPTIVDTSGVVGRIAAGGLPPVPIAALVGDQQSAMMGQLRVARGEVKITYGTAAMLDLNAGTEILWGGNGTYPLALWQRDGVLEFCLEGTAITAGAAITWLRDGLGIIATPAESGVLAASVADSGGVWAIPAFQGLGTPYLEPTARAVVGGLSRASTRAHVVRAVLEGVAYRCREVYDALRTDCPHPAPTVLRADGGMARNDVLLQAEADALGLPVERPVALDASALGAAYLAGLATGVWSDTSELVRAWQSERIFEPRQQADEREARFAAWKAHVAAAREAS
jgi:glycerol kinase